MLLALDTSNRTLGVALYDDAHVLGEFVWTTVDHHTVEMAPAIADLLERCGVGITALTALGVAIGPGSFTGLRIGLSVAKGLALARCLPLVGIPSLDILAAAQPVSELPLLVALQVGRKRLAVGSYRAEGGAWVGQGSPEITDLEALSQRIQTPTRLCGEFTAEERHSIQHKGHAVQLASPAQSLRRPGILAELAWKRWQAGQTDDPALLAPIYLHVGEPIPA